MTTPTIAEPSNPMADVAGKLSAAQRKAMTSGFIPAEKYGGKVYTSMKTARSLRALGLIGHGNVITLAGLALREYLSQPLQGTGE